MFAPRSAFPARAPHAQTDPARPGRRPAAAGMVSNQAMLRAGAPLAPALRNRFSAHFHADLSQTRIHTDDAAATAAARLGARAFAVGDHIFFARNHYAPDRPDGLRLIAHELAHVAQQRGATEAPASGDGSGVRASSSSEEREARHAAAQALAGRDAPVHSRGALAVACEKSAHTDDDLSDVIIAFKKKNDHLSGDQLRKIRNAVVSATYKADTFEVAWSFFDYYSGWTGQKIFIMTPAQEEAARKQDRLAETSPGGDTYLRADALALPEATLGPLLLHELGHTGHATNFMGAGDYQEGHAYGIEYFYAEKTGDTARMARILAVIGSGAVAPATQKPALQELFKVAYCVMKALRRQSLRADATEAPLKGLSSDAAQYLMAEYATRFASPSDRLEKIIAYVKAHLANYGPPPL